ncbi:flagellar hook-associated protein FlgK [Baekduia sp. Peel2402]|uniref:flagellar hook-associated protein FlgK n=1 Tax=Baekduia sp. Peel2402 TaxID=3458296 RepID=UPI00403E5551
MTIPAFSGLNTALRGVQAHQSALDVTSHNIANVDTDGYTRQQVVLGAAPSLLIDSIKQDGTGAQLGQGVDVLSYRRVREDFLDLQYRTQSTVASQAETTARRLTTAQSLLGSGTANDLGALVDKFWTSWDTLASNPSSQAAKDGVVGAAQNLATRFNSLDKDLAASGQQATDAISDMLSPEGPIKPIANELASLNQRINIAVQSGSEPNDLLDRRDQLLDQLSQYGQVSVTADPTLDANGNKAYPGMIQVSFAGATQPLVSQTAVTMPTTATISATPGGQLGGLQDAAAKIASYRTTLSSMASSLITGVNTLATNPIFSGTSATDIATVATGATVTGAPAGGAAGDNSVAAAIAKLRGGTVDTAYAGLVRTVGSDVQSATNTYSTATSVQNSISGQRQSVSGVSLDEEMSNLIKFQRGYQAAARALTTMDDILNTLINSTGRVGM